jgi:hypothetical protein
MKQDARLGRPVGGGKRGGSGNVTSNKAGPIQPLKGREVKLRK